MTCLFVYDKQENRIKFAKQIFISFGIWSEIGCKFWDTCLKWGIHFTGNRTEIGTLLPSLVPIKVWSPLKANANAPALDRIQSHFFLAGIIGKKIRK